MTRRRSFVLAAAVVVLALVSGASATQEIGSANGTITVKTFELSGEFKTPWQVQWIADGTADGAIAFTDRSGNAVGLLDPTSGSSQRVALSSITSPNGIAPIDFERFAVAGTGGVAIFDSSGAGKITTLQMPGRRLVNIAVGPGENLFVTDGQNNEIRRIAPPYAGPSNITTWPLPTDCGPTGIVPHETTTTVLCGIARGIIDVSNSGATVIHEVPLPVSNAGAQELRPAPNGYVFSAFNSNQVFSFSKDYSTQFKSFSPNGPAVPLVGYFGDPNYSRKLEAAAQRMAKGKKPEKAFFFNTFTPSFRGDGFSLGAFPAGSLRPRSGLLTGRNLVGSAVGPGGSILVADATPGKPAIHEIRAIDPLLFRKTKTRYPFPTQRLTVADPDFVARMAMPFFSAIPNPPKEVQVGIVGSSSSPWVLGPTFKSNFDLKVTVTGTIPGGGTYKPKVASADTGPYTQVLRITAVRPKTTGITLTMTGTATVPATFEVKAQAVTPPPEPCKCDSLEAELRPAISNFGAAFLLTWSMECTKGTGRCSGLLTAAITAADRGKGVKLKIKAESGKAKVDRDERNVWRVECGIECHPRIAVSPQGVELLELSGPHGEDVPKAVGSITVEVDRFCARERAPKIFDIKFNADGRVSKNRSDLNGNGIADGKEKRR